MTLQVVTIPLTADLVSSDGEDAFQPADVLGSAPGSQPAETPTRRGCNRRSSSAPSPDSQCIPETPSPAAALALLPGTTGSPSRLPSDPTAAPAAQGARGAGDEAAHTMETNACSDDSEVEDLTVLVNSKRKRARSPGGPVRSPRSASGAPSGAGEAVDKACSAKELRAQERAAVKKQKELEKQASKRAKALQREQARAAKEALRAAAKTRKAVEKECKARTSGKTALDNVFVSVDDRASGDGVFAGSILPSLREKFSEAQTRVVRQHVAGSITFQRFVYASAGSAGAGTAPDDAQDGADAWDGEDGWCRREETAAQVVVYVAPAKLVQLVELEQLLDWASQVRASFPAHCCPLLLAVGVDKYVESLAMGARERTGLMSAISGGLSQLLVLLRFANRLLPTAEEAAAVVLRMARAVAQEPYRPQPSVVDLYRDSKASAGRANSHSSGIACFFQGIPGIGEACATAISHAYPSLRALVRAFKQETAREKAARSVSTDGGESTSSKLLVQDLVFAGLATSSRSTHRVGPKRAERIHTIFHCRDPNRVISTLAHVD